jgi:hypothetical protein
MKISDKISEIKTEIKNLETQKSNLFGCIKGTIIAKDSKAKLDFNKDLKLITAKIIGLNAELRYLQQS